MPVYYYQSIDKLGKKASNTIEAANEGEAKDKLRMQGLLITGLSNKKENKIPFRKRCKDLKGESLVTFTTQLAELLKASLPLYESLNSIEEQYRKDSFHPLIIRLCESIKEGGSLSSAMREFPASFSHDYCAMVEAGESIGALDIALDKLALMLAKKRKLNKQIVTALLYPAILLSFSCLTILMLLTFVIPTLEGLFEGREVNAFTSLVISFSHFFTRYPHLYIPVVLAIPLSLLYARRKKRFREWSQKLFLSLPIVKKIMVETALARFTRTLGSLLQGGVTMIAALQCARGVMRHPLLEKEIEEAEKKIVEGSRLSRELRKSKLIPTLVPRLLTIGEEGGKAQEMLLKLADIYEEEVEKKIARFLAILQPAILLLMGLIVGIIMLAVLLPLTDVNSFMNGG